MNKNTPSDARTHVLTGFVAEDEESYEIHRDMELEARMFGGDYETELPEEEDLDE